MKSFQGCLCSFSQDGIYVSSLERINGNPNLSFEAVNPAETQGFTPYEIDANLIAKHQKFSIALKVLIAGVFSHRLYVCITLCLSCLKQKWS